LSRIENESHVFNVPGVDLGQDFGPEPIISGSFSGTIRECLRWLSYEGVSVVLPGEVLEEEIVFVQADPVPASVALRQLAALLPEESGVFRRAERVYFIGEPRESDVVARVFVCPGPAGDYASSVRAIGSDVIEVESVNDILIVCDVMENMQRIERLFPSLVYGSGQYVVQVSFVEVSDGFLADYGIDIDLAANLEATYRIDSESLIESRIVSVGDVLLSAALSADSSSTGVRLLNKSRLSMIVGHEAELSVGEEVPVPIVDVSPQGVASTTGFELIRSGFNCRVGLYRDSGDLLRLVVNPSLSQIQGYVDGIPIRMNREFSSMAIVRPGDSVMLGGFRSRVDRREVQDFFGLPTGLAGDGVDGFIYVVVRVLLPGEDPSFSECQDESSNLADNMPDGDLGPVGYVP
jgi:type II secretory pathway component GspD/PulD (secretin)